MCDSSIAHCGRGQAVALAMTEGGSVLYDDGIPVEVTDHRKTKQVANHTEGGENANQAATQEYVD